MESMKYEASQYVISLFSNILFSDPDILLYFLLKHTEPTSLLYSNRKVWDPYN